MSLSMSFRPAAALLTLTLAGAADAQIGIPPPALPGPISVKPSLIVTDQAVLRHFTLRRVLEQLAAQSGAPNVTATALFQQLFDSFNDTAGGHGYPHQCDDQLTPDGLPGLNGFPWECPRNEGREAGVDPFFFAGERYLPAALVNRFDLAPRDGAHCGEYRIVYDIRGPEANFIIFEAVLPNPSPQLGIEGCRPVAEFWASLSHIRDVAGALEQFYFQGGAGFEPVVHVDHYGVHLGSNGLATSSGQVRTNSFISRPWSLREFKLTHDCRCGPCSLSFVPVPVAENPYGELFQGDATDPLDPAFRSMLIANVTSLANPDINRFSYSTHDERLNAAESISEFGVPSDYESQFIDRDLSRGSLWSALRAELRRIGSPLEPIHIVRRAQALSCAGCHFSSNGRDMGGSTGPWPLSNGFTHVEHPAGDTEAILSPAMNQVFLPFRARVLESFLSQPVVTPILPAPPREVALPAEMQVICTTEASGSTALRSYPASALRRLEPVLAEPLGGRQVH